MDQTVVNSGNLMTDMTPPVNPPAEIEDPDDQKPEDWDERPKIQDPSAVKPEDWSVPEPPSLFRVTMVTDPPQWSLMMMMICFQGRRRSGSGS